MFDSPKYIPSYKLNLFNQCIPELAVYSSIYIHCMLSFFHLFHHLNIPILVYEQV